MADEKDVVSTTPDPSAKPPTLTELAILFLRLGITAFGGPAAHIAMMEDEVVTRRRWMSRENFLDLLGATNLIPGPNSTEMAIHIGLLAGWRGFIVAGACFILPAAILTGLLAWVYVTFGTMPEVAGVLYGIKPVVIAVVLQALWKLVKDAIKSIFLGVVGVLALMVSVWGVDELIVLLGAGLVVVVVRWIASRNKSRPASPPVNGVSMCLAPFAALGAGGGLASAPAFGLWPLFLFFIKVGSVLFGSGYVLLAFLRADLVERWGWLTEQQLLDAVAAGQITPGPVFTTATFIGYVLGGPEGAIVATVGIFLPAFFFVAISGPLVSRIRQWPVAGNFLDGVVVGSLALMGVVTWQFGRSTLVDVPTVMLASVSAFLLLRYRINSTWLVLAGALVGFMATFTGTVSWWQMEA